MNEPLFEFTENFARPFPGAAFVLTGFDLEDEAAIKACLRARHAHVEDRVSGFTECLIVNENYDHETHKYLDAWDLYEDGEDISIISFAMFRELCPEVVEKARPAVAELRPIPFGPGELVFKNALWSSLYKSDREDSLFARKIREKGGYYVSPLKKTHYVVFNLIEDRENRFYPSLKKREAKGELRLLPLQVFTVWAADDPPAALKSAAPWVKRVCALHYFICPEPWRKSPELSGQLESFALGEDGFLSETLFSLGEHAALLSLFELLVKNAPDAEALKALCARARSYGGKAASSGDPETNSRYLEFLHRAFPPELAEASQNEELTLAPLSGPRGLKRFFKRQNDQKGMKP